MMMFSNTKHSAQLKALINTQIEQAKQEERFSGYISPKTVAEAYRLINQFIALSENKQLNVDNPVYLYGLYTALLKLHKKHEAKQKILFGRVRNKTIGEIARLEYMLNELKTQYYSSQERSTSVHSDIIDIKNDFQLLLR